MVEGVKYKIQPSSYRQILVVESGAPCRHKQQAEAFRVQSKPLKEIKACVKEMEYYVTQCSG